MKQYAGYNITVKLKPSPNLLYQQSKKPDTVNANGIKNNKADRISARNCRRICKKRYNSPDLPPDNQRRIQDQIAKKLRRKQIGHNAQDLQAAYDVNDTASHHTPQTALCIIYKMIHLKSPHFKTDPSY